MQGWEIALIVIGCVIVVLVVGWLWYTWSRKSFMSFMHIVDIPLQFFSMLHH
jgi:hypothetical protein